MNKLGALVIALAVITLAACKDDKKGGGGGMDGKTGCVTNAGKVAELVTSKTPGFLAPFTGLKLGMSREEVAKACPNFFADDDAKGKQGNFSVNEIVGKFPVTHRLAREPRQSWTIPLNDQLKGRRVAGLDRCQYIGIRDRGVVETHSLLTIGKSWNRGGRYLSSFGGVSLDLDDAFLASRSR